MGGYAVFWWESKGINKAFLKGLLGDHGDCLGYVDDEITQLYKGLFHEPL